MALGAAKGSLRSSGMQAGLGVGTAPQRGCLSGVKLVVPALAAAISLALIIVANTWGARQPAVAAPVATGATVARLRAALRQCSPEVLVARSRPSAVARARSPLTVPHPSYLDGCRIPHLVMELGEQRRIHFECEGQASENQFSWAEDPKLRGVRIDLADRYNVLNGLCGALFRLSFTTQELAGELWSQPGERCGHSRRYCIRGQRLRRPDMVEPWRIELPCGEVTADPARPGLL